MKCKRRVLGLLLAIAVSLPLAACGQTDNDSPADEYTPSEPTVVTNEE